MAKEFLYRGKNLQELQELSLLELSKLMPSRQRRTLSRLTNEKKQLILELEKKDKVKTHRRDMVVLPQWVGKILQIYNGKEFTAVTVEPEMIGLYLGELAPTRKLVKHSSPGVGATRSSAYVSVK